MDWIRIAHSVQGPAFRTLLYGRLIDCHSLLGVCECDLLQVPGLDFHERERHKIWVPPPPEFQKEIRGPFAPSRNFVEVQ
jgi:hypothetical protein